MTSRATDIHPMLQTQVTNAAIRCVQIEAVAAHLADLMEAVHGYRWTADVSHEAGAEFIKIRPHLEGKAVPR